MKPTYEELEARCAALAAENTGLKSAVIERKNLSEEIRKAGRPPHTDFWHQSIYMADKKVDDALNSTPATDAFLAEVRAGAVDEVCLKISNAIINCYQDEQIGLDAAATICGDFTAQLRQGGAE